MIVVKVLLSLIIIVGLVALRVKKLRRSIMSFVAAGLFFVVTAFLFGPVEMTARSIV